MKIEDTDCARHDWERRLGDLLALFGRRNWIVVADAAYPAQADSGIETIVTGEDHAHVVRKVFDAITTCNHIRATVHADAEFAFVAEYDAPGIGEYRKELKNVLYGTVVEVLPHESIVARLEQAAHRYRILVIKTEMTIPYTSVFFELNCGYWNADAEGRLRLAMAGAGYVAGAK